jgi:hypothetical protein
MLALVLEPYTRARLWGSVGFSIFAHTVVHLGRLELGKQLIHREGLILLRL